MPSTRNAAGKDEETMQHDLTTETSVESKTDDSPSKRKSSSATVTPTKKKRKPTIVHIFFQDGTEKKMKGTTSPVTYIETYKRIIKETKWFYTETEYKKWDNQRVPPDTAAATTPTTELTADDRKRLQKAKDLALKMKPVHTIQLLYMTNNVTDAAVILVKFNNTDGAPNWMFKAEDLTIILPSFFEAFPTIEPNVQALMKNMCMARMRDLGKGPNEPKVVLYTPRKAGSNTIKITNRVLYSWYVVKTTGDRIEAIKDTAHKLGMALKQCGNSAPFYEHFKQHMIQNGKENYWKSITAPKNGLVFNQWLKQAKLEVTEVADLESFIITDDCPALENILRQHEIVLQDSEPDEEDKPDDYSDN